MLTRSLSLVLLLTTLVGSAAFAQEVHSLDNVREAAVHAVRARLPQVKGESAAKTSAKYFVTAAALDSRLRLAKCPVALETIAPATANSSSRVTMGVRCPAGNPWTVYVPVTIEVELPVLVLQRALGRDARVTEADVQLQTRRVAGTASSFIGDAALLPGRHLKRPLSVGTPLTMESLVADVLVRRGQQVTLLAQTGSIEIRAQGQALSDGGIRDRIRVQNSNSLKVVEGVIENAGTVRVEM